MIRRKQNKKHVVKGGNDIFLGRDHLREESLRKIKEKSAKERDVNERIKTSDGILVFSSKNPKSIFQILHADQIIKSLEQSCISSVKRPIPLTSFDRFICIFFRNNRINQYFRQVAHYRQCQYKCREQAEIVKAIVPKISSDIDVLAEYSKRHFETYPWGIPFSLYDQSANVDSKYITHYENELFKNLLSISTLRVFRQIQIIGQEIKYRCDLLVVDTMGKVCVFEVDGGRHEMFIQRYRDSGRVVSLNEMGIDVVRVKNASISRITFEFIQNNLKLSI